MKHSMTLARCSILALMIATIPQISFAQGSIWGVLRNADQSTPANGEMRFVGFLDNTDEEIRTDFVVGAGYDNGNWYDDFQNYLTEGAGNPYRYHFCNITNSQGAVLSKNIPSNSFQQENITLALVDWPEQPQTLVAERTSDTVATLYWAPDTTELLSYHIYRRVEGSGGSFFRVDNPAGLLSDPGVFDTTYIDSTVSGAGEFEYILIAENSFGDYSRPSEVALTFPIGCCDTPGDASNDGKMNIGDVTFIIAEMFLGGPAPECRDEADPDGNGKTNIGDVTFLISRLFLGGGPPVCGTTGS